MSNRTTISCEDYLADVELEEGLSVLVQDSGKVFKCITGHDGRLTWQAESSSRYDFPETSLQLQEIEFQSESSGADQDKVKRVKLRAVRPIVYLN
ncbi:MAG: hypothetical protein H7249_07250 [Chitinophagaceae bacterium]|nr:hypothetical protein [Oligoflexus sp.]